ncbi:MAG: hypothetical protein ACW981_21010 [Candidatus Hodarchaeales archaeon]|jgi:hypothetical protein
MQLPTHLIFGILIQWIIITIFPANESIEIIIQIILIIILCISSHYVIDAFAIATYHPPEPENTKFWRYWHIFVFFSGFVIIIFFFNSFLIGMFFANLVDLWDWVLRRHVLKRPPQLHWVADKLRTPLKNILPDLTYNKYGIIPELILIVVTYIYIILVW